MHRLAHWLFITILALASGTASAVDFDISGQGKVVYVTDGDTLIVRADDRKAVVELQKWARQKQKQTGRNLKPTDRFRIDPKTFVIRVGGINTAESVHPDASRNTAAGRRASAYAKHILNRKRVNFRCWEIGYYGRAICSVWTRQWEFGSHMITQGYSDYVTKYGRHPFLDERYRKAAAVARARAGNH